MGERVKYGSLFSGACDGLSVGFEWACADKGFTPTLTYQVEIDPWCRSNLARHWPTVPRYEDIRGLTVPRVDVIVGGFPCQDLSLAGKGEGILGERSGLWFEYLRIIQETQPQGVLIENVPGLLRRGLDVVVEGLSDAGYDVEATRLKASDVGAPHKRERVFIVAHANGGRRTGLLDEERQAYGNDVDGRRGEMAHTASAGLQRRVRQALEGWTRPDERCVEQLADTQRDILRDQSGRSSGTHGSGAGVARDDGPEAGRNAQPGLGRDAYGLPSRVDRFPTYRGEMQAAWEPPRVLPKAEYPARGNRLKGLGNAVVPQCAYIAAQRLLEKL